jgi:hypothetical protein
VRRDAGVSLNGVDAVANCEILPNYPGTLHMVT